MSAWAWATWHPWCTWLPARASTIPNRYSLMASKSLLCYATSDGGGTYTAEPHSLLQAAQSAADLVVCPPARCGLSVAWVLRRRGNLGGAPGSGSAGRARAPGCTAAGGAAPGMPPMSTAFMHSCSHIFSCSCMKKFCLSLHGGCKGSRQACPGALDTVSHRHKVIVLLCSAMQTHYASPPACN